VKSRRRKDPARQGDNYAMEGDSLYASFSMENLYIALNKTREMLQALQQQVEATSTKTPEFKRESKGFSMIGLI
jgi:hypothetical protein